MKDKIIEHFKSEYSSSPVDISEEKIDCLIKNNCTCDNCGESIFELDDFPVFKDDGVLCEHCDLDKNYEMCPICQDYFEKAFKADDFYFLLSKEAVEGYGMKLKPGFYRTLRWPFYYGNCVTGFEGIFDNTLELIHECDINSMLKKLDHGSADENLNGEVCQECLKIWTGQTEIKNNYCDKEYGAQYIAKQKEVIKNRF